jgi:hypothetical protein
MNEQKPDGSYRWKLIVQLDCDAVLLCPYVRIHE